MARTGYLHECTNALAPRPDDARVRGLRALADLEQRSATARADPGPIASPPLTTQTAEPEM